jgi:hypothetical protein
MHVIAQGAAQAAESARVILVFVAIVLVAFWKVVLRLLIAVIVIAILVAAGSGAIALMHGAHL